MFDRNRLEQQLISDEGVVYEIYLDSLGYPTLGVGHLITASDRENGLPVGTRVAENRVWELFRKDIDLAIMEARVLFGQQFDEWPGEVQEILINMIFQMGRPRVSRFVNMRRALESRDWKEAARHGRDSLWWREHTRNRAERLMARLEQVTP